MHSVRSVISMERSNVLSELMRESGFSRIALTHGCMLEEKQIKRAGDDLVPVCLNIMG